MGARHVLDRLRAATRAGGAGASGLASLLEVCVINAAADTFVAIALADSVFFAGTTSQARSKVAISLLTTMAPFALLAPVIGPLLDRFSHGRRLALAATFLARAFLAWTLAGEDKGLALYPVALGVLVGSRAFSLAKSSAVPRVLPHGTTLVQANSRLQISGVLIAVVCAPIAALISKTIGHGAVLRVASVVFLAGVLMCFRLPEHVDSSKGETSAIGIAIPAGKKRGAPDLGGTPYALRSQSALRGLAGFLTLFLAFQLRGHGNGTAALGGLAAAASVGSAVGVALGGRLKRRPESLITLAMLMAVAATAIGAIQYAVGLAIIVALVASLAASMGKLALDSVIQRDVHPMTQASAFGKSETALQLAWVIGGALGLIPWSGRVGMSLAAVVMAMALLSRFAHRPAGPPPPRRGSRTRR